MSTPGVELSLDDLIKQRKQASRGGARGGRGNRGDSGGRGAGPVRRSTRGAFRASPYGFKPTPMDIDGAWNPEVFGAVGVISGPIETGTKLYISNLDFGVSNEDIRTLFSEVGELKRSSVNYDRSGRSKGTAEVVFVRKADALSAMQKYSNVSLDGKVMKIELIGTNLPAASVGAAPFIPAGRGFPQRGGFGFPFRGRGRGGFRAVGRGRGRGGGRGRGRKETPKSQDELDAELDAYQSQKDKEMQA